MPEQFDFGGRSVDPQIIIIRLIAHGTHKDVGQLNKVRFLRIHSLDVANGIVLEAIFFAEAIVKNLGQS